MNEKQANFLKNTLSNFGNPIQVTTEYDDQRIQVEFGIGDDVKVLSPYLSELGSTELTLWAEYNQGSFTVIDTIEVGVYGTDLNQVITGTSFTLTLGEFSERTIKMLVNAYCVGLYHGGIKEREKMMDSRYGS